MDWLSVPAVVNVCIFIYSAVDYVRTKRRQQKKRIDKKHKMKMGVVMEKLLDGQDLIPWHHRFWDSDI